jgi:hypothetical protein
MGGLQVSRSQEQQFWKALKLATSVLFLPGGLEFQPFVSMLLLTGIRAEDAAGMRRTLSVDEYQHGAALSFTVGQHQISPVLHHPSRILATLPKLYMNQQSLGVTRFSMSSIPSRPWNHPSLINTPRAKQLHPQLMSGYQQSGESSRSQNDNWRDIEDQTERRRIQNRLSQRKYRKFTHITVHSTMLTNLEGEKEKKKRDDEVRVAENQQVAGSAYTAPDARDLARNANPAGLPWGSVSLKHVVETGKAKEELAQQVSREGSAGPAYRRTTQG